MSQTISPPTMASSSWRAERLEAGDSPSRGIGSRSPKRSDIAVIKWLISDALKDLVSYLVDGVPGVVRLMALCLRSVDPELEFGDGGTRLAGGPDSRQMKTKQHAAKRQESKNCVTRSKYNVR